MTARMPNMIFPFVSEGGDVRSLALRGRRLCGLSRASEDRRTHRGRSTRSPLVALVLTALLAFTVPVWALEGEAAVDAARKALGQSNDYPWYDRESDDLRRVELSADDASDDPGNRASQWESGPKQKTANAPSTSLLERIFWDFVEVLFWLLLAGLLGVLVWLLVRAFLRGEFAAGASSAPSQEAPESSTDIDRIESLPFQVRRPKSDLLGEARRQYEAGKFDEAIVYLFSYELVELDRQQIIRLAKGKTNRQYLRELPPAGRLRPLVEETMVAFEDVFFGHHHLSRDRFERCWRGLDEFHSLLEQMERAAA